MDELDREGKRDRSKKCPNDAQARVQEQLRAINPVLANPEEFRASLETLAPCSVLFFTFSSVMECKLPENTSVGFYNHGTLISYLALLPQFVNNESVCHSRRFLWVLNPGPKPIAESTGKEDKRRRVTPENKPKHPGPKEHDHKKGE